MKLRVTILASAPLGLLLTGCPLTDHYQLLQEGGAAGVLSAGADTGGDGPGVGGGGLGGGEIGSAGAADAGEPAVSGGGSGGVIAGGGSATGGRGGELETAGNPSGGTSGSCDEACNVGRCVAGSCKSGWVGVAQPPSVIVARSKAASVAIGESVFIWGGLDNTGAALADGAIYNPNTDAWTPLPKVPSSPTARIMATAVWAGASANKVIVYGGASAAGDVAYHDGAVYDLGANTWKALPANAKNPRIAPVGYWDGTRAVFFGGVNANGTGVPGADRFDLTSWSSSGGGDPGNLAYPAAAVDASVLYLQGGLMSSNRQDKVFSYNSSTDSWTGLSKSLSPRSAAFGAWDGTRFVVWGGRDELGVRDDGKTLSGSTWSNFITGSGAPSARMVGFRRSGWSFQVKPGVIAILGGISALGDDSVSTDDTLSTDGASFDAVNAKWTRIPDWTSLETHEYGVGVWTGEEFVLWGGGAPNASTLLGERWMP